MSWAGFKKNVNRATTQVMMKTGHVERTSDRDYEVEERYLRAISSSDSSDKS
jgi:bridging integrator 3